jgi:hypothetical protein
LPRIVRRKVNNVNGVDVLSSQEDMRINSVNPLSRQLARPLSIINPLAETTYQIDPTFHTAPKFVRHPHPILLLPTMPITQQIIHLDSSPQHHIIPITPISLNIQYLPLLHIIATPSHFTQDITPTTHQSTPIITRQMMRRHPI